MPRKRVRGKWRNGYRRTLNCNGLAFHFFLHFLFSYHFTVTLYALPSCISQDFVEAPGLSKAVHIDSDTHSDTTMIET